MSEVTRILSAIAECDPDTASRLCERSARPSPWTERGGRDRTFQMHRTILLILTAVMEVGIGICLMFLPSVPLALLLGVSHAAAETTIVARVAGAALLAIGVACWVGRQADRNRAQLGLFIGVLVYDATVAGLLAYAGVFLNLSGIALWPVFVLHSAMAVWCVMCLRHSPHRK